MNQYVVHSSQQHTSMSQQYSLPPIYTPCPQAKVDPFAYLELKFSLFVVCKNLEHSGGSPFSHMYDHSFPHSRLATGDVEGEWCTRAPIGPS
ncbi:unnamed protein product [Spirodela intermedia]|uniref:Uncharacterized protein n=1 Tax=Spirodela intermedia TaxID=51605 RepID=A0A7I8L2Z0_SPIIN|nr:unnamed protein product [Spirodela intermedia]